MMNDMVIIKMMHKTLIKKKKRRPIGKESRVAALCVTEIKTKSHQLHVINAFHLLVPIIMSRFLKAD